MHFASAEDEPVTEPGAARKESEQHKNIRRRAGDREDTKEWSNGGGEETEDTATEDNSCRAARKGAAKRAAEQETSGAWSVPREHAETDKSLRPMEGGLGGGPTLRGVGRTWGGVLLAPSQRPGPIE